MFNFPFQNTELFDRFANGIRKAGLPALDFKYYKVFQKNMLDEKEIRELIFGCNVEFQAGLNALRTEKLHGLISQVRLENFTTAAGVGLKMVCFAINGKFI